MSKQPPAAPTASAVSLCPTLTQISRMPRHWKFTQHHRTTRPPHAYFEKVEKGMIMKLLDSISELISNIDIPEI